MLALLLIGVYAFKKFMPKRKINGEIPNPFNPGGGEDMSALIPKEEAMQICNTALYNMKQGFEISMEELRQSGCIKNRCL